MGLHIKRIFVKDWLGIKETSFSPGKINRVSGDSGSGKTSLIEGLEKALTNRSRRTEVIRHGENEAELLVELTDGLIVNRKVRSEKADYFKVTHDSKAASSTEGFLRKLINGEIFRPIEFINKEPKEQAEIILNMLHIDWTTDDIKKWFGEVPEADYQLHILQILRQIEAGYYSERESINREISLLRANIEGIKRDLPPNYDGEAWRTVNLQKLYSRLSAAEESNKRYNEALSTIEGLTLRIEDIRLRSANATQAKKLDYQRQRDTLTDSIRRLGDKVEAEQMTINDADRRIAEANQRLDNDLEQAIERLRVQFQAKKQSVREDIQAESEQSRLFIGEYKEQIAEKKTALAGLSEHERKDLEKIADHEAALVATENEKSGNAQAIIDNGKRIDTLPLKTAADEAAHNKEYLREWERMNDIIREKLAPKEERSAALTAKIQTARDLPKELLKTAALPVEGLEVDAQGRIRINGTLIDGLSEGEAWEFAFKFAKSQAGALKVICIDGFQNLGSRQREIMETAATDDYQYFLLETVDGQSLTTEILEG
jgi:exonuclease SbcC